MNKTFSLSHDWLLKAPPETQLLEEIRFPSEGIPATVPGTVHTDLLNAGLIPDPFYSDNELRLKWIHEGDWEYQTTFDLPDELDLQKPLFLVFEGLDTIAENFLTSGSFVMSMPII
jgi:beta-mannosidase